MEEDLTRGKRRRCRLFPSGGLGRGWGGLGGGGRGGRRGRLGLGRFVFLGVDLLLRWGFVRTDLEMGKGNRTYSLEEER